tara:strand:+ start:322 stop:495 length:174 start_codon:yes stop_codon:yes gene_type:complete
MNENGYGEGAINLIGWGGAVASAGKGSGYGDAIRLSDSPNTNLIGQTIKPPKPPKGK